MKKLVALMLMIAIAISSTSALACTGYYAGRGATVDGTTLIGHTVDSSTTSQTVTYVIPRVENQPGRKLTSWGGVSWDLPDTTYAMTTSPFSMGFCDNGVCNEMGVAISSAVTCYLSPEIAAMEPTVRGGLSEGFLCRLVGLTAATAREGIQVMADYIEKVGNAEQNIIFIVDKTEAWYMETYTGKQWCAVKMPEDCVAVMGNQFMLGAVDVNSEDVLCSEGLISVPEAAGLAVFTEDGLIDLFATYSGGLLGDGSNRRTWYGHKMLAPSTAGEYGTYTKYDLFYQPDEKVTLNDMFEVTRARFEDTPWECDISGRLDQRVIGTEKQANCNVLQVYHDEDLPAALSCVSWICMANAEHSVYLPHSNLITDVAEIYKRYDGKSGYDLDLAHVHFKRLCALAEQDRVMYGQGVRDYWYSVEKNLVDTFPGVLEIVAEIYKQDPAAAAKYITDWTIDLQEDIIVQADTMFDELMWYMIKNTIQQKYGYDSNKLAMKDSYTQDPFVPSLAQ